LFIKFVFYVKSNRRIDMLVEMPTWQPIEIRHNVLVSTIELNGWHFVDFFQENYENCMDEIIFKLNCKWMNQNYRLYSWMKSISCWQIMKFHPIVWVLFPYRNAYFHRKDSNHFGHFVSIKFHVTTSGHYS